MTYDQAVDVVMHGSEGATTPDGRDIPPAVIAAITRKFKDDPGEAIAKLTELYYDHCCGCWFFTWANMLVGVEADGYMHT